MRITNDYMTNPHPVSGTEQPELKWATERPSTHSSYTSLPTGTHLIVKPQTGVTELWVRVTDSDDSIHDWRCVHGVLQETVSYDDFTDGGAAVGTIVLTADLPAGAVVYASNVHDITGFAGDTSAVLTLGDGSDADRYMTSTTNVFTTGDYPASDSHDGRPSAAAGHTAAMTTITVTVTSASDFTSVSAGQVTVTLFYVV